MPRKSAAALAAIRRDSSVALPRGRVVSSPRELGKAGKALWQSIASDYNIDAGADVELLTLACEALDRAQSCRDQIEKDGVLLGGKDHPLLKHELANRAFVTRALQRLGLEN